MSSIGSDAPLGVFDSGLGGLTVVRALRRILPNERIVYLGDTARVPYGTRGSATITKYALSCTKILVARGVKALVVACNTVSAVAPERLRVEFDIPVLGVIEPSARAAVAASKTGRIGVLATPGTIRSGAYARAIGQLSTRAEVVGQAAPLLVPLAEEGWTDGPVPRLVARKYIEPLARAGVDVIVLGCTHYPIMREAIEEEVRAQVGEEVAVIDSAQTVAVYVRDFLSGRSLLTAERQLRPKVETIVTDAPSGFREVAARFLGDLIGDVEAIDL